MNPRPTPIQKPITTPTPELSAYQEQAIHEYKLIVDYPKLDQTVLIQPPVRQRSTGWLAA